VELMLRFINFIISIFKRNKEDEKESASRKNDPFIYD